MQQPPYNLLIAAGQSPQVVTETIFELHRAENRHPASVHVVTTEVGRAYGRALLLGEERTDPIRGTEIEGADARWPVFCKEVLDRNPEQHTVDLAFYVPEVEGRGLDDIRQKGDDTRFADLCYRLVEKLTREDALPLIGSIAGGRKTMSAHLMTAFSVYARPDDRLTHILLTDPSLEQDPTFFYPEAGSPDYSRLLDLVDVEFPRLRTLIEADLIEALPDDRRDLKGILDALEPHINSARTVREVRLELRDRSARLVFEGTSGLIDTCSLTTKQASTLLVFAEERAGRSGPVPSTDFVEREAVEANRNHVRWLCSEEKLTPWTNKNDVSKALNDLNDALKTVPVAERILQIEGVSSQPRRYDWPEKVPPLSIDTRHTGEDWPFENLPAPDRMD